MGSLRAAGCGKDQEGLKYLRLIGLLIFLVLLCFLDLPTLLSTLSNVHLVYLVIAIILNGPLIILKAWRWQFLLGLQAQRYSPWRATVVYLSSLFAGFLTPGRLGEFIKALYVTQDTGMPASRAMSSVLTDRLFDLYALLICCGYGLAFFSLPSNIAMVAKWLIPLIAGVSLLFVHPRAEGPVCWLLHRIPWVKRYTARLVPQVHDFYQGMASLWKPQLPFAVLLTVAAYAVFFIQCYLLTLALEFVVDFGFVVFAISTTSLVSLIPISVSGLGTRDAILAALLAPRGVGTEVAVAYSTLILITFYVAAGGVGAIAWSAAPLDERLLSQIRTRTGLRER